MPCRERGYRRIGDDRGEEAQGAVARWAEVFVYLGLWADYRVEDEVESPSIEPLEGRYNIVVLGVL